MIITGAKARRTLSSSHFTFSSSPLGCSPFKEKRSLSHLFAATAALACCSFAGAWKRTAAHVRVVVDDDESIIVKKEEGLRSGGRKELNKKEKRQ